MRSWGLSSPLHLCKQNEKKKKEERGEGGGGWGRGGRDRKAPLKRKKLKILKGCEGVPPEGI